MRREKKKKILKDMKERLFQGLISLIVVSLQVPVSKNLSTVLSENFLDIVIILMPRQSPLLSESVKLTLIETL